MNITRRSLSAGAFSGLAALGLVGCTSVTTNGVTTDTLNVARIVAAAEAISVALAAVIATPAVIALAGPDAVIAASALGAANLVLEQIKATTGDTITVVVSTPGIKAQIATFVAKAQTAIGLLQPHLAKLNGPIAAQASNLISTAEVSIAAINLATSLATSP